MYQSLNKEKWERKISVVVIGICCHEKFFGPKNNALCYGEFVSGTLNQYRLK
jgi:hypothetical protein